MGTSNRAAHTETPYTYARVCCSVHNTELEPTAPRVTPIKDKIDQVLLVRELLLY
jgi:hypothetical protein